MCLTLLDFLLINDKFATVDVVEKLPPFVDIKATSTVAKSHKKVSLDFTFVWSVCIKLHFFSPKNDLPIFILTLILVNDFFLHKKILLI